MFLGFFAIGGLVATAVFAVIYAVTGQGMVDVTRLADLDHPTPAGLAFLNVALATFIPLAMFGERSCTASPRGGSPPCGRASGGGTSSRAWASRSWR